jgi:hypothetical protein
MGGVILILGNSGLIDLCRMSCMGFALLEVISYVLLR